MTFTVADLTRHQLDAAGVAVEQIYIKIDTLYAIYRTEERVVIQFADDQAAGAEQRKGLSELYVTRGAIDSLLDEMRDTKDPSRLTRARRYERRLADALTLGLQGQINQAGVELNSLQQDLMEERKSGSRQAYLAASLAVCVALVFAIAVLSSPLFNFGLTGERYAVAQSMWFSAAVGTVGAFFSTVLAIRNRQIEPTISVKDTMVDAGLRLFAGAISGALLYALIRAGTFGLQVGGITIGKTAGFSSGGSDWLFVLLVAFAAGFLERLVPDMLAKVSATDAPAPKAPLSTRSAAQDAAASERTPLGAGAGGAANPAAAANDGAPDPANDEDDCCDRPGTPELLTQDVELPEAVGGVEAAPNNG